MTDQNKPAVPVPKALRRQQRNDGGYDMIPAFSTEELLAYGDAREAVGAAAAQADIQREHIRFANLSLDLHRLVNWEAPINDFPEVADLQEMIAGFAESQAAAKAEVEGLKREAQSFVRLQKEMREEEGRLRADLALSQEAHVITMRRAVHAEAELATIAAADASMPVQRHLYESTDAFGKARWSTDYRHATKEGKVLELVLRTDALAAVATAVAQAQTGKAQCGECHLQPGERCDICGAVAQAREVPAGYVLADQAYNCKQLYADLCDAFAEASAVDTVIARPAVLMHKLATMRDAVGRAVNCYIPLAVAQNREAL